MLKLLFVAAMVIIVILIVAWVFLRLADAAKKSRNKTVSLLEANLEELKKQSAILAEMMPKTEDPKSEVK